MEIYYRDRDIEIEIEIIEKKGGCVQVKMCKGAVEVKERAPKPRSLSGWRGRRSPAPLTCRPEVHE